jgi:hypothetical protein
VADGRLGDVDLVGESPEREVAFPPHLREHASQQHRVVFAAAITLVGFAPRFEVVQISDLTRDFREADLLGSPPSVLPIDYLVDVVADWPDDRRFRGPAEVPHFGHILQELRFWHCIWVVVVRLELIDS